jgi:hypothetical protein
VLLGFSLLPALIVGFAVLLMRGYDLTEERLAAVTEAPVEAGSAG